MTEQKQKTGTRTHTHTLRPMNLTVVRLREQNIFKFIQKISPNLYIIHEYNNYVCNVDEPSIMH